MTGARVSTGTAGQGVPERLRLACVIASLGCGGAERVMSRLAGAWSEVHDVAVFTYDDGAEPPFYRLPAAVALHPLALDGHSATVLRAVASNLRRWYRLRAALRSVSPDVVVSFGDRVNVLTLLATRGLRTSVIVSERVDPRLYDPGLAWRTLRWLLYRQAAAVVVQTERTRQYFAAGISGRFVTIPNPVGPSPLNMGDGEPLVVGMGRLVPQKGFDILLKAFARARLASSGWQLVIAGEGPVRAELEALAATLGIAGATSFPGNVPDSASLLGRAGIFALTSRFEGFPNVLAEAMALGRPVVATDCLTGPRELTMEGVAGVLVPVDDVDALAGALSNLAAAPPLRRTLGDAARAAVAPLSLGRVVETWDRLFRLTRQPRATPAP